MKERIISIDDRIEWLKVKALLEENNIPYREKGVSDSTFPSLTNDGLIEIVISEDFSDSFFRLVEKEYPSRTQEVKEKKVNISRILLWVYAIVMTGLFWKYYDLNRKNSDDKNFTYEWSFDNVSLVSKEKRTGKVSAVYIDANFNNNYEKIESYTHGKLTVESFDRNEDGFIDKEIIWGLNGKLSAIYLDTDYDRIFEESLTILENGDTLKFKDRNKNGIVELE